MARSEWWKKSRDCGGKKNLKYILHVMHSDWTDYCQANTFLEMWSVSADLHCRSPWAHAQPEKAAFWAACILIPVYSRFIRFFFPKLNLGAVFYSRPFPTQKNGTKKPDFRREMAHETNIFEEIGNFRNMLKKYQISYFLKISKPQTWAKTQIVVLDASAGIDRNRFWENPKNARNRSGEPSKLEPSKNPKNVEIFRE